MSLCRAEALSAEICFLSGEGNAFIYFFFSFFLPFSAEVCYITVYILKHLKGEEVFFLKTPIPPNSNKKQARKIPHQGRLMFVSD